MARAPLFTWLKNKFYTKTEIDSKMDGKAPNTVVSSTSNGLMIATDKEKLDTVEVGANNTVVDGSMSATSSNPVQNKTVKAELDSLNNAKANIEHTHKNIVKTGTLPNGADLNDYTSVGYWTADISITPTLLNKPTNPPISSNSGIRLEVLENSNGAIQIITTYHVVAEQVNIYFRHYVAGEVFDNWSDWSIILTNHNQSLITP